MRLRRSALRRSSGATSCRLSVMAGVYNLFNANPETNVIMRSGRRFDRIIEWLPGRALKLGVRLQF